MQLTVTARPATFARPDIVRQRWYLVASSRQLARGRPRRIEFGLGCEPLDFPFAQYGGGGFVERLPAW